MDRQIVKWAKTLTPAILYLALHQLLRAFGASAEVRAWVIVPVAAICFHREKSHVAGTLRLGSARGAGIAALTVAAAALLNTWCFPGGLPQRTPGMLVAAVIAGPIGEELIYRGMVFDRGCRFFGPGQAVIWSAVLFGLAHTGAAQMAAAAVFGAALCLLRMRFRSIAAPILVHGCVNLLSGWEAPGWLPTPVLAVGALGLSGLTVWLLCCGNFGEESCGPNRKN